MRLYFTKMHGLGNDYIYMDGFDKRMSNLLSLSEEEKGQLAVKMSRRHTGIGADGLIFIWPSRQAAFRMEMYNADGSRGAMCGNGIRCAARYAYDRKIVLSESFQVATDSGLKQVDIRKSSEGSIAVRVDMGVVENLGEQMLKLEGIGKTGNVRTPVQLVDVGNVHCVLFAEDVRHFPLQQAAEAIHRRLENKVDVNLEVAAVHRIAVSGEKYIQMRVFERGSGETMACGTGACAVCAAAVWQGYCRYDENMEVRMPGGSLMTVYLADGRMMLEGPAEYVFEGQWEIEETNSL